MRKFFSINRVASSLMALFVTMNLVALPAAVSTVSAASCDTTTITGGANCANPGTTSKGLFDQGGIFQSVVHIIIFLVGAIAVIMLIVGGIRFVVSGGNEQAVTAARHTILYAVIGIIVAILAFAIVDFVIKQVSGA